VLEGTATQIVQSMKSIALGAPTMTLGGERRGQRRRIA
jgi:hypothetical protein